MIHSLRLAILVLLCLASQAHAADEKCLAAMHDRVEACANDCVAKARAAVDPSVRDLTIGRACAKNCLKIEMFHGQSCP
jgi:hypothetical protein